MTPVTARTRRLEPSSRRDVEPRADHRRRPEVDDSRTRANASGGADVSTLERDVNTALQVAPNAIKADVRTMANVELPILDGKVPPSQIGQKMADPHFRAAVRHISTWAAGDCHG